MWYAIISEDVENSLPLRKIHRPAHLERLKKLNSEGRVLIAGPHPVDETDLDGNVSGSLIVVDFESLEEAQKWANADPYVINNIHSKVTIKPFNKGFP